MIFGRQPKTVRITETTPTTMTDNDANVPDYIFVPRKCHTLKIANVKRVTTQSCRHIHDRLGVHKCGWSSPPVGDILTLHAEDEVFLFKFLSPTKGLDLSPPQKHIPSMLFANFFGVQRCSHVLTHCDTASILQCMSVTSWSFPFALGPDVCNKKPGFPHMTFQSQRPEVTNCF